ncbi:MAG: DUF1343 domain-containing protein, partial [Bacteroidales bacterium]|nr:DUF1343 domain-containing protein [Bacteroidales bacterium]
MKKLFSIILILAVASPMIWAQHKCGKNVKVKPGVEVLRDGGFKELQGKRVGLLTNPTGVDS